MSGRARIFGVGIGIFTVLVWALLLPGLTELNASDAAGNGLAQAFSALHLAVLWLLLVVLALVAAVTGGMTGWRRSRR